MIRLEVQPYCHQCRYFEADVERPAVFHTHEGEYIRGDTVIRCARQKHCKHLIQYLEKIIEGESNKC